MSQWVAEFKKGPLVENPLTVLMIGLCPTLAVSTKVEGALFMGFAVIFVMTASSLIISSVRRFVPELVRIPVFIVIIASFVTIVDLTMHAFLPDIYTFLGVWIPLIVVNCLILGRAEAFAYHNPPRLVSADGLGMGIGFLVVIVTLAFIREFVGSGQIVFMGTTLLAMPSWYRGPGVAMLFPGGFLVFGFLVAAATALNRRLASRKVQPVPGCTLDEGGPS